MSGSVSSSTPTGETRRVAAVLFADLKGFTSLSERLDPEEVRDILDRVFSRASEIIESHGGHIDKYMGDAVLALFGIPRAFGDDVDRAVLSALRIQHAMREIARDIEVRYGLQVALRIGVHTGTLIYGERSFEVMAGPVRVWPGRTVQFLSAGVGVIYLKELREAALAPAGVTADSRSLKAALRLRFRNGWGMGLWGLYGRWYEAGTRFPGWMTGVHLSSDWSRTVAFWSSTTLLHDYNYARQVLGITGQVMGGLRWQANNHTALYTEAFLTREWDGAWQHLYTTLILRPSLSVTLRKGLDLRIYANPYGAFPYSRSELRGRDVYTWREARWIQNRYGVFLSWNLRPKSWVYVTLQQTQTWDEDRDRWHQEGGMALKVRWLFLF
ncbi:MAG: adenylate/guanylate cyclase domain-containing protein [Candidatus Hydrothermae bacterium]|nr:adenylate/guanylate cyclase domain-containing protein [Candidatus Hydrothermae bacterium]